MSKLIVFVVAAIFFCGISNVAAAMGFAQVGYTLPVIVAAVVGFVVG